jgi:putative peptidoglycan lipid II flippase
MHPDPGAVRSGRPGLLPQAVRNLVSQGSLVGLVVMGLIAVGRAFGFVIPFFIANWFGVTGASDAFFFVYGSATFFIAILSDLAEGVLVPALSAALLKGGPPGVAGVVRRASRWVILAVVACYLLGFLGFLVAGRLWLRSSGSFDWSFAFQMYIWSLPLVGFAVIGSVFSAALLAAHRFFMPALAPGVRGVVTLLVIYLARPYGVGPVLVLAYTAGELSRFALLGSSAVRLGLLSKRRAGEPEQALRALGSVALFQAGALTLAGLNPLISRFAATHFGVGSVTLVEIGEKLQWIPMTLFNAAISTVGLSRWSHSLLTVGASETRARIQRALRLTAWAAVGSSLAMMAFGEEFARLFLSQRAVLAIGPARLAEVIRIYAVGLAPFSLVLVLSRSLLVLQDTRHLFKLFLLGLVANVVLVLLLAPRWQVRGIAWATSFTSIVLLITAAGFAHHLWAKRAAETR